MESVKWVDHFEYVEMRMSVWIETFEIVRFKIRIIYYERKKSEITFYCCWMTAYCRRVDILNVLEWE